MKFLFLISFLFLSSCDVTVRSASPPENLPRNELCYSYCRAQFSEGVCNFRCYYK
jgi:hypothetical protein